MRDILRAVIWAAPGTSTAPRLDGDNWETIRPLPQAARRKHPALVQYFAHIESPPENPQNLWREYEKLGGAHPNFAMQHIEGLPDIYPVFRELFKKKSYDQ